MIRSRFRTVLAGLAALIVGLAIARVAPQATGVLNSQLTLRIAATGSKAQALSTASFPVLLDYSLGLANGVNANQASDIFYDRRTLTASSTENLDLFGTLTNAFGVTLNFTKVKVLAIHADAGNVNDVLVGGAASNGWVAWVNDPTDVVKIKPGGTFIWIAPDVNGGAVTTATADLLKVANSSSGTSVIYDVTILGVS